MRRSFRLKVTVSGLSLLLAFAIGGCSGTNAGRTNINMGMDAIEAHDYAGALSCFSNAVSAGEDTRLAYRGMGIAYMGQGAYDSAIASFETALKSSNGLVKKVDYDINYYLAMAQYKSGDLDKAMETYNAILALDELTGELITDDILNNIFDHFCIGK